MESLAQITLRSCETYTQVRARIEREVMPPKSGEEALAARYQVQEILRAENARREVNPAPDQGL